MKLGRIFYLIPPNEKPCGGILIMFQHCAFLRAAGFDAYPLFRTDMEVSWFEHSLKHYTYSDIKKLNLKENDVVIGSEVFPYEATIFKKVIKIMFVQGWGHVHREVHNPKFFNLRYRFRTKRTEYRTGLKSKDLNLSYEQLGYKYIFTVSQYTKKYLRETMGLEAYVVRNGIDLCKFMYVPNKKIENTILCLPRKHVDDIEEIKQKLSLIPGMEDIEWIYADNLSQDELIKYYQKSDIFLATGYPEGFGLPALEAMACGCAVVGFTGMGASEFMIDGETSLVAVDGDCEEAAKKVITIVQNKNLKEKLRVNGIKQAMNYNFFAMKDELIKFFKSIESNL